MIGPDADLLIKRFCYRGGIGAAISTGSRHMWRSSSNQVFEEIGDLIFDRNNWSYGQQTKLRSTLSKL